MAIAVAAALVAWVFICAQAISLVSDRELARRAAVADRDFSRATDAADAARDIQPLGGHPTSSSRSSVKQQEISANREYGSIRPLHGIDETGACGSYRLASRLGRMEAAERSLRRANALNPRSPLFNELLERNASG